MLLFQLIVILSDCIMWTHLPTCYHVACEAGQSLNVCFHHLFHPLKIMLIDINVSKFLGIVLSQKFVRK